jgi:hypothetical protein
VFDQAVPLIRLFSTSFENTGSVNDLSLSFLSVLASAVSSDSESEILVYYEITHVLDLRQKMV